LKKLVEAHEDADARHQVLVDLIAPAARNIHAYWLARRAPARDTIGDTRRPIHKMPVPGRNDPKSWTTAAFAQFQFFDPTGLMEAIRA
jgi:uncharacterized protein